MSIISLPQAVVTALLSGSVSLIGVWIANHAQGRRDEANNARALRAAKYQRSRDAYKALLHAAVTWQSVAMRKSNDLLPSTAPKAADPALTALFHQSLEEASKAEIEVMLEKDGEEVRDQFYATKFAYVGYFYNAETAARNPGPSPAREAADLRHLNAEIEKLAELCRERLNALERVPPRATRLGLRPPWRKRLPDLPPNPIPFVRALRTGALSGQDTGQVDRSKL